jgi:hypothetical protein
MVHFNIRRLENQTERTGLRRWPLFCLKSLLPFNYRSEIGMVSQRPFFFQTSNQMAWSRSDKYSRIQRLAPFNYWNWKIPVSECIQISCNRIPTLHWINIPPYSLFKNLPDLTMHPSKDKFAYYSKDPKTGPSSIRAIRIPDFFKFWIRMLYTARNPDIRVRFASLDRFII